MSKPRAQFEVVPTDVARTEAATADEGSAERVRFVNLIKENRMLHVLEFLLKFGVDTVDDLMYCMRYYDDEELMKFIGLPRFQILRLRKAAETWDTSDSAHEAASNPPPPQQEQIVPN